MKIRAWAVEAYSGKAVAELPLLDWSGSDGINGGSLSASISLDLASRDGSSSDWGAVSRMAGVHGWIQAGFRSLAITGEWLGADGEPSRRVLLGEWVVAHASLDSSERASRLSGFPWADYPRYIHDAYRRQYEARDAGEILAEVLGVAFGPLAITVPNLVAGYTVEVDRVPFSGQLGDVAQELVDQSPGLEWTVRCTPTWDGDRLASVQRQVVMGVPTLDRQSTIAFEAGETGTRHGNCTVSGGEPDMANYARDVIALGAGQGADRLVGRATDLRLGAQGYLFASKIVHYPEVHSQAALDRLARGELARSLDTRDGRLSPPLTPYEVTARVDALPEVPRVGDRARLIHPRSQAYPGGIDAEIRVGEVAYRGDGPTLEIVSVKAV